jgi:hypothetical protein
MLNRIQEVKDKIIDLGLERYKTLTELEHYVPTNFLELNNSINFNNY